MMAHMQWDSPAKGLHHSSSCTTGCRRRNKKSAEGGSRSSPTDRVASVSQAKGILSNLLCSALSSIMLSQWTCLQNHSITSLLLHYTQKYLSAILITITLQHIGNFGMIFLPGVLKWWLERYGQQEHGEKAFIQLIALLFARTCTYLATG